MHLRCRIYFRPPRSLPARVFRTGLLCGIPAWAPCPSFAARSCSPRCCRVAALFGCPVRPLCPIASCGLAVRCCRAVALFGYLVWALCSAAPCGFAARCCRAVVSCGLAARPLARPLSIQLLVRSFLHGPFAQPPASNGPLRRAGSVTPCRSFGGSRRGRPGGGRRRRS